MTLLPTRQLGTRLMPVRCVSIDTYKSGMHTLQRLHTPVHCAHCCSQAHVPQRPGQLTHLTQAVWAHTRCCKPGACSSWWWHLHQPACLTVACLRWTTDCSSTTMSMPASAPRACVHANDIIHKASTSSICSLVACMHARQTT
jgi:hypothetical protein